MRCSSKTPTLAHQRCVHLNFCWAVFPLLPRLHAYELMMAPYAIAHMKIGPKLAETGYRFGTSERAHYQKIVVALSETIRLMAEIDRVIDAHGGWPGAFQTSAQT